MAAGMTIYKQDLTEFKAAFNNTVAAAVNGQLPDNVIWSDGEIAQDSITLDLARELREAGPWGQSFEEPMFHGDFLVLTQRILSGKHLKLQLENPTGKAFEAIAFFQEESILDTQLEKVRLVYKMDVNYFRGHENLQLMVDQIVPL